MNLNFTDFYQRVCQAAGIATQMELATILGVNRSAITQAKNRNSVPAKWVLAVSRKYAVSPDWLERGEPNKQTAGGQLSATRQNALAQPFPAQKPGYEPELVNIPKISARLCAGGGSLAEDATVLEEYALPLPMVRRFGQPKHLVFMEVVGDSMEPGVQSGDLVLIDQSSTALLPLKIMAVGYEDNIYIKRVQREADGGLTLLSDNSAYAPIRIRGDERESFRILGKLVWLCRNLR